MIKLVDLLKEVETQQVEEDWKSKLAGGMMTAASLFGSGDTKAQVKEPTAITQQATKRQGTAVDGIVGEFTSQFQFPIGFMTDLNTNIKYNLGVEGNKSLTDVKGAGMTKAKMDAWNKFVAWMKSKGYSGSSDMNSISFGNDVLADYKEIVPDFWIKDKNDIMAVQKTIKVYRAYTIAEWMAGEADIDLGGNRMNPKNPEDVEKVKDRYMIWAKDIDTSKTK